MSRSACITIRPILGQPFEECRTGLDHISFGDAGRSDLDAWANWLDELGIEHSGVIDTDSPMQRVPRQPAS